MSIKKWIQISFVCALACGCSNAGMQELHPADGTVTLYGFDGKALAKFKTNGKPEMSQGGHLYLKERDSGRLVILYGAYVFEEDK